MANQKTLSEQFFATRETDFDEAFWNRFLGELTARLKEFENIKIAWESLSQDALEVALERINEVLGPAAERIQNIAALGFLSVESKSSRTLAVDVVSFTAEAGDQLDLFVPTPFVAVTRATNPFDFAIGRVIYFNRDDRIIDIDIVYFEGDPGPHNDWTIAAVAGQALAQTSLLNQTVEAKDEAVSAKNAAAGYQADVTTKAGTVLGLWNAFRMAVAPSGPTTPITPSLGQFWYDGEIVRVYDGSGWVPAVTASIGGIRTETGTFGASPSGNITVGGGFSFAMVWLNGLLLKEGTDYTASTPLITISGAAEGDEYMVWAYQANDATDYYTKEEANTLLGGKVSGPASLTAPALVGRLTGTGEAQALSQAQGRQLLGGWEFVGSYALAGLTTLAITGLGIYKTLRISGTAYFSAVDGALLQFSSDNGTSYGGDADEFRFTILDGQYGISANQLQTVPRDANNTAIPFFSNGGDATWPGIGEYTIHNFNNVIRAVTQGTAGMSTGADRFIRNSVVWHKRAVALNALRIFNGSGSSFSYGYVHLEGVR